MTGAIRATRQRAAITALLEKLDDFRSAQELTMWNSELRLATNFDGPLNFIVGGIYQNRTTKINNSFVDVDLTNGQPIFSNPVWYERAGDFKLTQWAGFGEATLKLSDKLSILGGIRVFQNKRHDIATSIVPFLRLGTAGAPVWVITRAPAAAAAPRTGTRAPRARARGRRGDARSRATASRSSSRNPTGKPMSATRC